MPAYEFVNEEHGLRQIVHMPVDQRCDTIVLKRLSVPSSILVNTGAKPPTLEDRLLAGYKKLEERTGLRKTAPHQLTASQAKRALER